MKKIHGSFFIETSSLNGQNIDEVFIDVMRNSCFRNQPLHCISIMKVMRVLGD